MQGAQKLGYKHFVQTKKPPCVPIAQRPERWLIEESLGSPVEIVAGHCAAHRLGVGVKQHLQISGCVGLELVAGQAYDVALGQSLLGDRSLGHNALLLAQGSGTVQIGIGSFFILFFSLRDLSVFRFALFFIR